jgi:hypothetical protein
VYKSVKQFAIALMFGSFSLACLSGCEERLSDVSQESKYRPYIGQKYVVRKEVSAYAIEDLNRVNVVSYLTLIPPPGIEGREVEGIYAIPPGVIIKIEKAYLSNRLLDNPLTFEIHVTGVSFPHKVPVLLDLTRGNENEAGDGLNPDLYQLAE